MSKNIARTSQGKLVDMGALISANETVIAVGNRKVNARGDELGPGGKIIKTRNQVMEEHYKTGNGPFTPSTMSAAQKEAAARANSAIKAPLPPGVDEDPLTEEEVAQLKKGSNPNV